MPSLKSITGRPSPTAWPDPAAVAEQPTPCNTSRSQWPFMVQGEEMIGSKPAPVSHNKAPTTISAKTIGANTVNTLFPGALHADSVTAAWAMSNGLGHLVKTR